MVTASDPRKQRLETNKLRKRLRRQVGQAIADYRMIEDGDRIMVCLSGGKDSYTLLDMLRHLQQTAPVHFDLIAVNMDQKQPGFPEHVLPEYLEREGVPYHIIEKDTYSVVREKVPQGKTTCGLCSRLRRGTLYGFAESIGASKIALGHHKDDIVETLFLNMFYGSRLKAMPPKLLSDDRRNVVVRPLAYCREADIIQYAEQREFPIIPCNLCGSQEGLQRQAVKAMLKQWERTFPGRTDRIFKALQNISPSQLADSTLFDFAGLTRDADGISRSQGEGSVAADNALPWSSEPPERAEALAVHKPPAPPNLWHDAQPLGEVDTDGERINALNLC